jgi:hypothetical protein
LIGSVIDTSAENKNNKGKLGHTIEKLIKLKLGSHHLDFEDGELKTVPISKGKVKEDFKICKKWDKGYIESKLEQMLVVTYDDSLSLILDVKIYRLLDHPIIKSWFNKEIDWLLEQPDINLVSQTETEVFIAKTNDTGNKAVNSRALYISGAVATYLFGLEYTSRMRKGKIFVKEMKAYEQTESRSSTKLNGLLSNAAMVL